MEKTELEEGQKRELNFIENEEYQFIRWSCENERITIVNPSSPSTTILSDVSRANGGTSATVTAVCAERPKVTSSNTMNQTSALYKDTTITLIFSRALSKDSDLASIKLLLSGVELSYGDTEAFGEPYFYDDGEKVNCAQVVIPANRNHVLDIGKGKTAQIKVIIPETLYYEDASNGNTKIYTGREYAKEIIVPRAPIVLFQNMVAEGNNQCLCIDHYYPYNNEIQINVYGKKRNDNTFYAVDISEVDSESKLISYDYETYYLSAYLGTKELGIYSAITVESNYSITRYILF